MRRKVSDEAETKEPARSIYGTAEEMMERAKEGYFVMDPERNLVYCPNGEILRQKCIKKNGREDVLIGASFRDNQKSDGL